MHRNLKVLAALVTGLGALLAHAGTSGAQENPVTVARWTSAARSRHCYARNLMKSQMATWSKDELRKIAEADDLHISPFREDGVTYGTPTWIWSVVVDDSLYVRAYNGPSHLRTAFAWVVFSVTAKGGFKSL